MKKLVSLMAAVVSVLSMQATTVTVTPNGDRCSLTVDETTYNDVPVTTVGDIHMAALSRDGMTLIVRYTDANTLVADGTVGGTPIHYESEAYADYAKTFQIPNSDFEEWNTEVNEPTSWHGFKTCFGDYAGSARDLSKLNSADHNGGKCAVVEAKKFLFVVANGTMTTGRLQAGNMSASNTANHSEMDISKTYTDNYAKYGPFYVLLNAKPDAIKSSLKVALSKSTHKATFSAAITDGTYYQEPQDKTYTNVAATAGDTQLPTKDWTDYTFPFSYNEGIDAKAIMVTVSTNAEPGTGTDGDKVYVDDMELIYRAAISNIALNGVTLDGFSFDAATTSYSLSYSGDALNITADNFDVTAEGMTAMVVKNVEDLGYGNYVVTIGATSVDLKNHALYTINISRSPITGHAYIMGNVNGNLFAPNVGVEMTAGDDNVYTARVTTAGENDGYSYFSLATQLAATGDDAEWDAIKAFRTGAESADLLIDDNNVDTALPLTDWGIYNSFKIGAGTWDMTLDLNAKTLTVSKVFNPITGKVYILGDVNDNNGWHANAGVEMTTDDQITYTAEVTTAGENNYFAFTTELAMYDDEGSWAYILPYRFGAPGEGSDDAIVIDDETLGTALTLGEWGHLRAYGLPAGKWNMSLDMDARTLTVTRVEDALRGDFNGDGFITVADVNILINIILGKVSQADFPNADMNGDNEITVGDANILINIILGR